jgi:hypothetical protein
MEYPAKKFVNQDIENGLDIIKETNPTLHALALNKLPLDYVPVMEDLHKHIESASHESVGRFIKIVVDSMRKNNIKIGSNNE